MWRYVLVFMLFQQLGCVSSEPTEPVVSANLLSLAAKSKPTEKSEAFPSCVSTPIRCPGEEKNLPYQCVAYRYKDIFLWDAQRVYAWGSSLCQTRKNLQAKACQKGLESQFLSDIDCTPDPTLGACQALAPKSCSTTGTPTFCSVSQYHGQEIPWPEQPTAWGESECLAKNSLVAVACQRGLNPTDLGSLTCEANSSPKVCPPIPPICPESSPEPILCQVSSIGDVTFKQPWTAIGHSACEAEYKLQEMACRFNRTAKELTPLPLGSMECHSLVAPP